jgi:signal peptidase I
MIRSHTDIYESHKRLVRLSPYYPDESMPKLPWIARIAAGLAFLLAALMLLSGFLGSIANIPMALLPLAAGIGILRARVWSAWGYALTLLAQMLLWPIIFSRPGHPDIGRGLILSALLSVFVTLVLLVAGYALADSGSPRGSATFWVVLTAILTLPQLFLRPFVIPSGSMEDTLLTGDRVLARTLPPVTPRRDELVAFVYPLDRKFIYTKRVIGIPGDRIRIAKKTVYRNGAALKEPYAVHKAPVEDPYLNNFPAPPPAGVPQRGLDMLGMHVQNGEVIVPIGQYFVIGDNRDRSLDSRYWGFVGSSDIVGKPLVIYDSEAPNGARRWNRLFHWL